MARLGAQKPGQKSEDPSQLSFLLSLSHSRLISGPPWALVSPKEAQVPSHLSWLLTTYWHVSGQLAAWAHVAARGPTVL